MPVQYVPRTSNFQPGMVGGLYHIGLSDGTNQYGYIFQNFGTNDPRSAFNESSDIADKQALTQFSSEALIDRDVARYPRVSQGDFSGGLLQEVLIDNTKAFDSDLEIRTPGYLMLRPAWQRKQHINTAPGSMQIVAWNNDVYTTWGGGLYYSSNGTSVNPGMTVLFIDTDGNSLFLGDGVNTIKATGNNSTFATVANAAPAFTQMWLVNQGTNGRFLYLSNNTGNDVNSGSDALYKIDTTAAFPATAVLVPTNLTRFAIKDVCEYQNGIAILTNDPGGTGFDVWYHDGVNMTRIVRVNQYSAAGCCPCLGDLFVTGTSSGQFEAPVLMRISSGSFEIVVRTGTPTSTFTSAAIGAPESSGQYVCFALSNPQINNVTNASYIGVFDAVTHAYSHLGSFDSNDAPQTAQPRQIAFSGRAVTFPMALGATGQLQYQTNSSRVPNPAMGPQPLYAGSGTIVSAKLDFNTPGIPKRFRRIQVHHTPLNAGEIVTVKAFIDQDPLAFTPSLAPVPSTATKTNSTVGSTVTTLSMASNQSVGNSLYYAVVLSAGTNQQTTPKIIYTAVEVGGTWIWDFDLNCTNIRRLLNAGGDDPQGVNGKDLFYLIRNAYENGTPLTLFLAENVSYTVNVEGLKGVAPTYFDKQGTPVRADEEWLVHVTLKQEAS